MAEQLEVSAAWLGGWRAQVDARGHEIAVDEPESAGGADAGAMPTELLCAAIASCYCLALVFAAGKRGRDLPGLRVTVRTKRVGFEWTIRTKDPVPAGNGVFIPGTLRDI